MPDSHPGDPPVTTEGVDNARDSAGDEPANARRAGHHQVSVLRHPISVDFDALKASGYVIEAAEDGDGYLVYHPEAQEAFVDGEPSGEG